MESIVILLISATTILFLILKFDTKQNQKVKGILKKTNNIQPLFLQRAVEQKLNKLYNSIYGDISPSSINGPITGRVNLNEGARQLLAEQLIILINQYNNGEIALTHYNTKLNNLIISINQVKHMNFEQIKS
ncbi:hypothetical protein [Mucilaginibacter sp.]